MEEMIRGRAWVWLVGASVGAAASAAAGLVVGFAAWMSGMPASDWPFVAAAASLTFVFVAAKVIGEHGFSRSDGAQPLGVAMALAGTLTSIATVVFATQRWHLGRISTELLAWLLLFATVLLAAQFLTVKARRVASALPRARSGFDAPRLPLSFEGWPGEIEYSAGPLSLRVSAVGTDVLFVIGGVITDLSLSMRAPAGDLPATPDPLRTGDLEFDRVFSIKGNVLAAGATLGSRARDALLASARAGSVKLSGGRLLATLPGAAGNPEEIHRVADGLMALAGLLVLPAGPVPRLLELARTDADDASRARAAQLLFSRVGESEAARALAAERLADADPAVRLEAALLLKNSGVIASLALDESLDPELRSKAIRFGTVSSASPDDALAFLERLLGQAKTPAVAVAKALAMLGDARGETMLLRILAGGAFDAKAEAVHSLGVIGTARAVEPLRAQPGDLRRLGEQAILRIRAKLEQAGPGQLSIPEEGHAGAVSVATSEGMLSLDPAPPKDARRKQPT